MGKALVLLHLLSASIASSLPRASDSSDAQDSSIPGPGSAYHQVQSNGTTWPWQVYKSSPQLPPNLTISGNGKALSPGYAFFSPSGASSGGSPALREAGGFVMTPSNELVYGLNNSAGGEITDFRVQRLDGRDYLTYWVGEPTTALNIGHGYGKVVLVDSAYRTAYEVCPDLGIYVPETPPPRCTVDLHEHEITPRGTMLVTAYNTTRADLRAVNGSADGWVSDGMFFEVDIKTQRVLFSWSSLAHVPVAASRLPLGANGGSAAAPYDYFHPNSVAPLGGDYLVNARHTWTTYLVSGKDGSILWEIDGQTGGSFGPLPAGGTFRWQHFARPDPAPNAAAAGGKGNGTLTLSWFDNHNSQVDNGPAPTQGLSLRLTLPPDPARNGAPVVVEHLAPAGGPLYADSQGSYQPAGGNQFMGYGQIPVMREYGPAADGSDLRWQARFGRDSLVQSYRALKQAWSATPAAWDPSLVVERPAAGRPVGSGFVSWNGATDVTSWRVYAGDSKTSLKAVGTVQKKGFETVFNTPAAGCVQVAALQRGREIRRSNVVCS